MHEKNPEQYLNTVSLPNQPPNSINKERRSRCRRFYFTSLKFKALSFCAPATIAPFVILYVYSSVTTVVCLVSVDDFYAQIWLEKIYPFDILSKHFI